MAFGRIVLVLSAVLWLPYGVYLCFHPGYLAEAAGVAFTSPTGSTEIRAMYGGLQTAVGILALIGCLSASLQRTALVALVVLCAGLGVTRLLGALADGGFSSYTNMALGFEWVEVALITWALRRAPVP